MNSNFRFYNLLAATVILLAIQTTALAETATWDILQLRPDFSLVLSELKQSRREESDFDRSESKLGQRKNLTEWEKFIFPMSKENAASYGLRQLVFRSKSCSGRAFVNDHIRSIELSERNKFLLLRGTGISDQGLRISRFDLVSIEKNFMHLQIICEGLFQEGGQLLIDELGFDWQIQEKHEPQWLIELYQQHLAIKSKEAGNGKSKPVGSDKASWGRAAYNKIRESLGSSSKKQRIP